MYVVIQPRLAASENHTHRWLKAAEGYAKAEIADQVTGAMDRIFPTDPSGVLVLVADGLEWPARLLRAALELTVRAMLVHIGLPGGVADVLSGVAARLPDTPILDRLDDLAQGLRIVDIGAAVADGRPPSRQESVHVEVGW
jgi:hypothetical protein